MPKKKTGSGRGSPSRRTIKRRRRRRPNVVDLLGARRKNEDIHIRVEDCIKNAAHTIAENRGTTVTDLITQFLERLVHEEVERLEKQF